MMRKVGFLGKTMVWICRLNNGMGQVMTLYSGRVLTSQLENEIMRGKLGEGDGNDGWICVIRGGRDCSQLEDGAGKDV